MLTASLSHLPRDPAVEPCVGDRFQLSTNRADVRRVRKREQGTRVEIGVFIGGEDEVRDLPLAEFSQQFASWQVTFVASYEPHHIPPTTSEKSLVRVAPTDETLKQLLYSTTLVPSAYGYASVSAMANELLNLRQRIKSG